MLVRYACSVDRFVVMTDQERKEHGLLKGNELNIWAEASSRRDGPDDMRGDY